MQRELEANNFRRKDFFTPPPRIHFIIKTSLRNSYSRVTFLISTNKYLNKILISYLPFFKLKLVISSPFALKSSQHQENMKALLLILVNPFKPQALALIIKNCINSTPMEKHSGFLCFKMCTLF